MTRSNTTLVLLLVSSLVILAGILNMSCYGENPDSPSIEDVTDVLPASEVTTPKPATVDTYRDQELDRVLAQPLETRRGNAYTTQKNGKTLECVPLNFTTVNWVGATPETFWLEGLIIYPDNASGTLGAVPGAICMHGLNGAVGQGELAWALEFASRGFVAFTYSHPGHGNSGGAWPNHENFGTASFNQTEHIYLLVAGCIRAVTLLEGIPEVAPDQIVLMGGSYGGWTTLLTSAIFHDHVRAGIPVVAASLENSLLTEGKLASWVCGNKQGTLPENWEALKMNIDPQYFVNDPNCPPQLLLFGTNDDYFSLEAANLTLEKLGTTKGNVVWDPNGHHGFSLDPAGFKNIVTWGSIFYFLDAVINGTTPLPEFYVSATSRSTLVGDKLRVFMDIGKQVPREKILEVRVFYHYTNINGEPWRHLDCAPVELEGDNLWEAEVPVPVLSSGVEYFIQLTLEGTIPGESAYFSSRIFTGPRLDSPFQWFFVIILFVALALPVWFIIHHRLSVFESVEYIENRVIAPGDDSTAISIRETGNPMEMRPIYLEYLFLIAFQALILIGFILPMVWFDWRVSWSGLFLANNIFTMFGSNLTILVLALVYLFFLITLIKPIGGGLITLFLPLVGLIFYLVLPGFFGPDQFGGITFGLGYWLYFIGAAGQVSTGIWKRHISKRWREK